MNLFEFLDICPLSFQPLCMLLSANSHRKKGGQVGGKYLGLSKISGSNTQVVLIG